MSALEFIRKNSLLVLIVVAGVGLGLLMMDYGDRGSMFVKDYYIQVNGTGEKQTLYDTDDCNRCGGCFRRFFM